MELNQPLLVGSTLPDSSKALVITEFLTLQTNARTFFFPNEASNRRSLRGFVTSLVSQREQIVNIQNYVSVPASFYYSVPQKSPGVKKIVYNSVILPQLSYCHSALVSDKRKVCAGKLRHRQETYTHVPLTP